MEYIVSLILIPVIVMGIFALAVASAIFTAAFLNKSLPNKCPRCGRTLTAGNTTCLIHGAVRGIPT